MKKHTIPVQHQFYQYTPNISKSFQSGLFSTHHWFKENLYNESSRDLSRDGHLSLNMVTDWEAILIVSMITAGLSYDFSSWAPRDVSP